MTEETLEKILNDKNEFDKLEIPEYKLNTEKLNEYLSELNRKDIYLPLIILFRVDYDYISRAETKARELMIKAQTLYRYLSEERVYDKNNLPFEFKKADLYLWVQEHPQYNDIILLNE